MRSCCCCCCTYGKYEKKTGKVAAATCTWPPEREGRGAHTRGSNRSRTRDSSSQAKLGLFKLNTAQHNTTHTTTEMLGYTKFMIKKTEYHIDKMA